MKKQIELRDALLALALIMLAINMFSNLRVRKADAETFKLDDCITTSPGDKPNAYLHVVTH